MKKLLFIMLFAVTMVSAQQENPTISMFKDMMRLSSEEETDIYKFSGEFITINGKKLPVCVKKGTNETYVVLTDKKGRVVLLEVELIVSPRDFENQK